MYIKSFKPINFKSHKNSYEPLNIEDINLIFGPNSSGKSSLIQALNFLNINHGASDLDDVFQDLNLLDSLKYNSSDGSLKLSNFRNVFHTSSYELPFVKDIHKINEIQNTHHKKISDGLGVLGTLEDIISDLDQIEELDYKTAESILRSSIDIKIILDNFINSLRIAGHNNTEISQIICNKNSDNFKDYNFFDELLTLLSNEDFVLVKEELEYLSGDRKDDWIDNFVGAYLETEIPTGIIVNFFTELVEKIQFTDENLQEMTNIDEKLKFQFSISTDKFKEFKSTGYDYTGLSLITDEIILEIKVDRSDQAYIENLSDPNIYRLIDYSIIIKSFKPLKNFTNIINLPEKIEINNILETGLDNDAATPDDHRPDLNSALTSELRTLALIYSFDEFVEDSFDQFDREGENKFKSYLNNNKYFTTSKKKIYTSSDSIFDLNKQHKGGIFMPFNFMNDLVVMHSSMQRIALEKRLQKAGVMYSSMQRITSEIVTNFKDWKALSKTTNIDLPDLEWAPLGSEEADGIMGYVWDKYGLDLQHKIRDAKKPNGKPVLSLGLRAEEEKETTVNVKTRFPNLINTIRRASSTTNFSKEIDFNSLCSIFEKYLRKSSQIFSAQELYYRWNEEHDASMFYSTGELANLSSEELSGLPYYEKVFKPFFKTLFNTRKSKLRSEIANIEIINSFENLLFFKSFNPDIREWVSAITETYDEFISTFFHIGPIRSIPEKSYEIDNGSEVMPNVGFKGEKMTQILYENQETLKEVNWVLENILDIPYSLQISALRNKLNEVDHYYITLVSKKSGAEHSLKDVGFGIGQILPIIVQCLHPYNSKKFVSMEQPELHLHPYLQGKLADMFIYLIKKSKNSPGDLKLLIETHSEPLIYRFLKYNEEKKIKANSLNFSFIEIEEGRSDAEIKRLKIDDDGDFENELPEGFLDNEYRTVTDKLSPWEEDIEEILKKSEESEILESENSAQDSDIEELRKKLEEIREQLESVKGLRVLKDDDGDLYCSNCKKIFYTQNGAEWHINSGWCLNA